MLQLKVLCQLILSILASSPPFPTIALPIPPLSSCLGPNAPSFLILCLFSTNLQGQTVVRLKGGCPSGNARSF